MTIVDRTPKPGGRKVFGICPFWQSSTSGGNTTSSSASSTQNLHNSANYHERARQPADGGPRGRTCSVSSVARSLLPARRRLRMDPPNNLYFPYEPGKQVRSAVRLTNSSRSHVAFKFQTTAKSCCMRPPDGILAPGESIIALVFKFVEHSEANEKPSDPKSKVKFKMVSLKVKAGTEYFDELKDQVTVERVLRVVFLDAERPSPAMEKLKHQLAEAEAAFQTRKKPPVETGPSVVGVGLMINKWK